MKPQHTLVQGYHTKEDPAKFTFITRLGEFDVYYVERINCYVAFNEEKIDEIAYHYSNYFYDPTNPNSKSNIFPPELKEFVQAYHNLIQ